MNNEPSGFAKLNQWLDERTGVNALTREALDEPIRGGARWAYVLGSALLFLILIQFVTGIALSLYYVPSADHAHASVSYIQKAVPGGAFIRGLHHYAASVMVIVIVGHLAQTFLFGAYKGKRELLWLAGVTLLLITLGFAFTGYLLPWDQAAYFGTKVGASIAGEIPVVGPMQLRIMLGGTDLTTITLSRFFTAHVFLLPLGLLGLVGLHIFLFRKAGAAGPFHDRDDQRVDRFFPKQVFKDTVCALVVFLVLIGLTRWAPAELGPVADPSSDYLARPAWYFLPLFQLLKYFPGQWSLIPTVILPGVIFAVLFALPFFDRSPERNPLKRPIATTLLLLTIFGAVGLIFLAKQQDRNTPQIAEKMKAQEEDAIKYFSTPFKPQEVGAMTGGEEKAAASSAPAPYQTACALCHGDNGEGTADLGPALKGLAGKPQRAPEDLLKILDDAEAYGLKKPMPKSFPTLSAEDKKQIVDWVVNLK